MTLVPIKLPPGFYKNGTEYEGANRWQNGSLVRWLDGSLRPIGGWTVRKNRFARDPIRGLHTWQDNGGTAWIAGGSHDQFIAMTGSGVSYDLTPDDLATGRIDAAVSTGYGNGYYGTGYYGQPRPVTSASIPLECSIWQIDNFGQAGVAFHSDDRRVFVWDLTTTSGSELVTNGEFATDTDWNKGVGWSIANGKANWGALARFVNPSDFVSWNGFHDELESVDANGNILSDQPFSDGDPVIYHVPTGSTALSPLVSGTTYYVKIDGTHSGSELELAATPGGTTLDLANIPHFQFNNPSTNVNVTNNTISCSDAHFVNGMPVIYNLENGATTVIGGLSDHGQYYVINRDTVNNTLQLSASYTQNTTPTLATSVTVTVANGVFVFDGVANPAITLLRGQTYTFDTSDSSNTNHPLLFQDALGVTFATVQNGVPGQAGSTHVVTVPISGQIPASYLCQVHGASMGNTVTVVSNYGTPIDLTSNVDDGVGFHRIVENFIVGGFHQLQYANPAGGNLDQTVSGLVSTPNNQDTYDFEITLLDPNSDVDDTATPNVTVKVTGTTSTTELVNQTLSTGTNLFRFGSDDTEVKIEIIPTINTQNFYIDDISLKQKRVLEPVANAPINNKGIVVTEERFLMCIGAGGNSRKIAWSDKEDFNTWVAAPINEAGDIELASSGQCMQAVRTRGGTLILTDTDTHLAVYTGPPYVYSVNRIATNSGAVSRLSAVAVDQGCFWYGQENFYYFDGNTVETLKCDVHDYVFNDFNQAQQSKVWGMSLASESEIWWFYCSSNSNEIDRYVGYDYGDGHWLIGNLSRTAGASRGVFANPFMTGGYEAVTETLNVTVANPGSGNRYYIGGYSGAAPTISLVQGNTYKFDQSNSSNSNHPLKFSTTENGTHGGGVEYTDNVVTVGVPGTPGSYTQITITTSTPNLYFYCQNHSLMGSVAFTVSANQNVYNHEIGYNISTGNIFCETGPLEIGNGDQIMNITDVISDERTQGDVNLTFKTKFHPNNTERSYGPFNPSNPTSLRFQGRQVKMRVDGVRPTNWKVGTMRLDVRPGGKR